MLSVEIYCDGGCSRNGAKWVWDLAETLLCLWYSVPYSLRVNNGPPLSYYALNPEHYQDEMRYFMQNGGERAVNILSPEMSLYDSFKGVESKRVAKTPEVDPDLEVDPNEVDLSAADAAGPAAPQPSAIDEIPQVTRQETQARGQQIRS